jgi:hypothetical protein
MLKCLLILSCILYYINCACTDVTPRVNTDCIKESSQIAYCCYAYNGSTKTCIEQNRIAWKTANSTTTNPNGLSLSIDCGIGAETQSLTGPMKDGKENIVTNINSLVNTEIDVGPSCGVSSPTKLQECANDSIWGNSCCLYEYSGKSYCYRLGKSWRGSATYTTSTTVKVTCSGSWVKMTNLFMILLVLFFI